MAKIITINGDVTNQKINDALSKVHDDLIRIEKAVGLIDTTDPTYSNVFSHGVVLNDEVTYLSANSYYHGSFAVDGTITAAYAIRYGGSGATVNAQNNGSNIRSSDLSLASAGTWTSFGTLQNTSFSAGDTLWFEVASVTGNVTDITIYIVCTTTLA